MTTLLADLRIAGRSLLKTRSFTATTVLTLALGMTLCMTAVAVMKAYLLENLPYPAADRLYSIRYGPAPQPRGMEALDWSALGDVIEHPVAWDLDVFYLLGGDHAESVAGAWVTPGFVQGLGIQPALGRGLDARAFAPGGSNEVLISHRLWVGRFAADPAVIGRTFTAYVSDRPDEAEGFTIVGVLPQRFWHINGYTDILAPLRAPTYPYLARLRAGVSADAAAARITSLVTAAATQTPPNWQASLVSTHSGYVQSVEPMLRAVAAAAALVLLVACANVAGLLVVRATRRQREIAVRRALGAGRLAIARMLAAEAVLIAGAATMLAVWGTRTIVVWIAPIVQQQLGRPAPAGAHAFSLDPQMLAIAVAMAFVTTAVCTFVPVLQLRGGRMSTLRGSAATLQAGTRTATDGPRGQRVRSALIVLEIAVSLTLVTGSTLMLRSVIGLLQTDLGFSAERVVNASITLRQNRYPHAAARTALFDRMVTRLAAIPGAESVGLTTTWPVQQPQLQTVEAMTGSGRVSTSAGVHGVNETYFATVRMSMADGRPFGSADRGNSQPVTIVSATLARRLWPTGGAVGSRLIVPQQQDRGQPLPVSRLVVGVVGDVRQDPSDQELADVYIPLWQAPGRFAFALVRTAAAPEGWLPAFRAAFRDVDPEISVMRAGPLQARVDDLIVRPRFLASLLGSFAAVAAVLALVGVYGVIAYAIRQREREIAVRIALGASAARLTRFFLRQGITVLAAGVLAGIGGSLLAGRMIASQLFGVTPRDPLALAAAAGAFSAAGLVAIWWPSRRAATTDPAMALRSE